jgi:hypothetical protein
MELTTSRPPTGLPAPPPRSHAHAPLRKPCPSTHAPPRDAGPTARPPATVKVESSMTFSGISFDTSSAIGLPTPDVVGNLTPDVTLNDGSDVDTMVSPNDSFDGPDLTPTLSPSSHPVKAGLSPLSPDCGPE